jgi:hypothetical protein
MSNDNISETVKELLAEAEQKTNELKAQLKEQKKKAPEAGTVAHGAYTKKLGRLKAKCSSANSIFELLFDMDDFNEELNQQRRTAEAMAKMLSDWIKEKEAVEQQLTDGGEREALRDQLDAIESKLEHYASKIGDGSISRIDRYESIIAEASRGEDKKRAREEDDARGDKMAKPSAAASPKSARGGGGRGDVGNVQVDSGSLGHLEYEQRQRWLKLVYRPLFKEAAEGEWVMLPARVGLEVNDSVKVVGVPDDHPYKDQIGIWRGTFHKIDGFGGGLEPHRFKQTFLRVVVKK